MDRIREIDLLRFVSAVLVVLFHYAFRGYAEGGMSSLPYSWLAPVAQLGHLGVYLFFMISGFVILMTARDDLVAFVISRAARLYPAFWACCTLTFLTILALGAPRFTASWARYLANMSLMGEFIGVPNLDGVYWSIFVEIRFYVLVALLIAFKQIKHIEAFMGGWIALVLLEMWAPVAIIQRIFITEYASFFVAGALFYKVYQGGWTRCRAALMTISMCLSLQHVLSGLDGFQSYYNTHQSAWPVALVLLSFHLVMYGVAARKTGALARTDWSALGALTYPLYLLHQIVGYVLFNHFYPGANPHALFWSVFVGMLAAAHLIHIGIERPLGLWLKDGLTRWANRHRLMSPTR
jgi:peptidoglycan/LPS O-acetylase OafA/YrhL